MSKIRIAPWLVVAGLVIAMLLITACQSTEDQSDTPGQGSDSPNQTSSSPGNSGQDAEDGGGSDADDASDLDPMVLAQEEWQISAHASSFVVDDQGKNNSCARCHAPKNWMPTLADIPESCQTCKFELEDPPPFIAESDWLQVSCVMCHTIDKKGNVQAEVAWLEIPALDEYASVESSTDLCLNCHNTEGIAAHGQVMVGSGHEDLGCLECHSPHSSAASCADTDCHADVLTETAQIPGHDEEHKDVTCAACHDSAGWEVGPDPDTGIWTTFSPWSQETNVGEEDSILQSGITPFLSHDLGLSVDCERCHFAGNPWELIESVEAP